MDEGNIRFLAYVMSLTAKVYAANAMIEGMKAANSARESAGYALAYPESAFAEVTTDLEKLSTLLAAA